MPIKLNKDRTNLIARLKVMTSNGRHYFNAYLWSDFESMYKAHSEQQVNGTEATCCLRPYQINIWTSEPDPLPLLGELHFVKDHWRLEHVAHELEHMIIHRQRVLQPTAQQAVDQCTVTDHNTGEEISCEEIICYEMGAWVEQVYSWLWQMNPNKKWAKVEQKEGTEAA